VLGKEVSEKWSDYGVLIIDFSIAAWCIRHYCIIHVFFPEFSEEGYLFQRHERGAFHMGLSA